MKRKTIFFESEFISDLENKVNTFLDKIENSKMIRDIQYRNYFDDSEDQKRAWYSVMIVYDELTVHERDEIQKTKEELEELKDSLRKELKSLTNSL